MVFGKARGRNPAELVTKAHQSFVRLPYESNQERVSEEIAKALHSMKEAMFGEDEASANKENALIIAHEACRSDLLSDIVSYLKELDFEARKDAVQIFGALVRIEGEGGSYPGRDYVLEHSALLQALFDGYDDADVALNCGQMLRDCLRHDKIAKIVLESDIFSELFKKMELSNFEVASDAFQTFRDLLTRHKEVVAKFLVEHKTHFFAEYTKLLLSPNYVTRRQCLKLLGELLLDRANLRVMMAYVDDPDHLALQMNLLKDASRSIQFEAFHVFKVFVANPKKSPRVLDILVNNRDKLLRYLADFHTDRDDDVFKEEKVVIIKEIENLPAPGGAAAAAPAPA